jgi:hypothetical protein
MPRITLALPVSEATRKRILHDYGTIEPIAVKRKTWLHNMVSQSAFPADASAHGITFQFHTPRTGTVAPAEIATQLDRYYNQLRNEVIATHIQLSDDLWVTTHALQVYNGIFGIETDVDISLEAMLKSWTRWKEAERERKNAIVSLSTSEGVQPERETMALEADIQECIASFIGRYRRRLMRKERCKGLHTQRVFELCCYVYRMAGFNQSDMALIFDCNASGCRKAAERFKYRLVEWQKQGVEPPTL